MASSPLGRVLVTGGSGFVGGHAVQALIERGAGVRCAIRASSRVDHLPAEAIELTVVDFEDETSLERAVSGCDRVLHVAGVTRASSEDAYHRVNAETTGRLAAACARAGIRRFVLVSSLAAAGPSTRERPRREEDPPAPVSAYGRSKLAGERALRQAAATTLPWTVIRPPAVYGPRDAGFLRLAQLVARGWLPRVGPRPQPLSVVDARDLARALVEALVLDRAAGRTFFVADPRITDWDEIGRLMGEVLGRQPRVVAVPRWTVPLVGAASAALAAVTGGADRLPADRLADLRVEAWTCSPAKALAGLGFTPRQTLAEGLREVTRWYLDHGWIRP